MTLSNNLQVSMSVWRNVHNKLHMTVCIFIYLCLGMASSLLSLKESLNCRVSRAAPGKLFGYFWGSCGMSARVSCSKKDPTWCRSRRVKQHWPSRPPIEGLETETACAVNSLLMRRASARSQERPRWGRRGGPLWGHKGDLGEVTKGAQWGHRAIPTPWLTAPKGILPSHKGGHNQTKKKKRKNEN